MEGKQNLPKEERRITARDFVLQNRNKYDNWKDFESAGIKATGCTPQTFYKIAASVGYGKVYFKSNSNIAPLTGRKVQYRQKREHLPGVNGFQTLFDNSVIIPKKIEEGIEKYLKQPDGTPDWKYDDQFRELCGVNLTLWRRYANEFSHLQVKTKAGLIWGHPEIIDEMKEYATR